MADSNAAMLAEANSIQHLFRERERMGKLQMVGCHDLCFFDDHNLAAIVDFHYKLCWELFSKMFDQSHGASRHLLEKMSDNP